MGGWEADVKKQIYTRGKQMLAIAFSLLLVISFSKFSVSAETLGEKETKTMSEPKVNEKNIEDTISPKEKKSEKTEIAEKSDKSYKSE